MISDSDWNRHSPDWVTQVDLNESITKAHQGKRQTGAAEFYCLGKDSADRQGFISLQIIHLNGDGKNLIWFKVWNFQCLEHPGRIT